MKEIKTLFRNKILIEEYFMGALACAALPVKIEKKSPVNVSLIEELIAHNLLQEIGYKYATKRRMVLTSAIQKNLLYLVSVKKDQFFAKISIIDIQNNFVSPI